VDSRTGRASARRAPDVRRALIALLIAGAFQATAFGIYELGLPLYLDFLKISFTSMGVIFGVSQFGILAVRYLVGSRSDVVGRKPFLVDALGLITVSTAVLPAVSGTAALASAKMVRDAAGVVRDAMRSLAVYEAAGARFVRWIGRAVGSEFFFMAIGAVAGGWLINKLGWSWTFGISAALAGAATVTVWRWFDEDPGIARSTGGPPPGDAGVTRWLGIALPPNLWVLTASSFVFNVGLTMSHTFYLVLFFKDKFGFAVPVLGALQMAHRFSLGIPMMIAGQWMDRPGVRRHYKAIFIVTMAVQGACLSLAGILPGAVLACGFFILHDIVGATFFSPIQAEFLQRWARPAWRGRDVALATGLGSLGSILGPLLAGFLLDRVHWQDGPFFVSGIIIIAASLVLLRLKER